jgi:ubiquinone/menaquinone biosynthesis C-methylase UbiE
MTNTQPKPSHRVCDYEGSQYQIEFWGTPNRAYEDAVERVAISNFLPPTGNRLIEIGAGFGRLADLYSGYRQVVLLDYARTQLLQARDHLGDDPRFIYVIGNVYNLPFTNNLFDTLTMIRVMHHLTAVPDALSEIHRILHPQATAVIEYANKKNLKALLRYFARRQDWNPFDQTPVEFVPLNFNFHPTWMHENFDMAGLKIEDIRTLSHYRMPLLKRLVPLPLLIAMDSFAQTTGNLWQLTPSVCVKCTAAKPTTTEAVGLFQCPTCRTPSLVIDHKLTDSTQLITCQRCRTIWQRKDGIYDFKTPWETPI